MVQQMAVKRVAYLCSVIGFALCVSVTLGTFTFRVYDETGMCMALVSLLAIALLIMGQRLR